MKLMPGRPSILIQPRLKNILFPTPNPPIGLGYIASYLEQHGFKTYLIDLNIYNTTTATLLDFIGQKEPLLVGISSNTPN